MMTQHNAPIVDWHSHVWLPEHVGEWTRLLSNDAASRARPESFEQSFADVDKAVVIALKSRLLGVDVPNRFVADFVAAAPERRMGVACVDPADEAAAFELCEASEMGFPGVKLSPPYQGFHPHDQAAWKIYETAAERGMFIIFHQGWVFDPRSSLETANPILIDRVAGAFPEVPIIIAHLGQPWIWETVAVMARRKNVFTDVSARLRNPWQLYNGLMAAMDYKVTDRVLFGSDFPIAEPGKAIEDFLNLNATLEGVRPIPEGLLREIVYERPLALVTGVK